MLWLLPCLKIHRNQHFDEQKSILLDILRHILDPPDHQDVGEGHRALGRRSRWIKPNPVWFHGLGLRLFSLRTAAPQFLGVLFKKPKIRADWVKNGCRNHVTVPLFQRNNTFRLLVVQAKELGMLLLANRLGGIITRSQIKDQLFKMLVLCKRWSHIKKYTYIHNSQQR